MVEPLDAAAIVTFGVYFATAYRLRFRAGTGFLSALIVLGFTGAAAVAGQPEIATVGGIVTFSLIVCALVHAFVEHVQAGRKGSGSERKDDE